MQLLRILKMTESKDMVPAYTQSMEAVPVPILTRLLGLSW